MNDLLTKLRNVNIKQTNKQIKPTTKKQLVYLHGAKMVRKFCENWIIYNI